MWNKLIRAEVNAKSIGKFRNLRYKGHVKRLGPKCIIISLHICTYRYSLSHTHTQNLKLKVKTQTLVDQRNKGAKKKKLSSQPMTM